MISLPSNLPQVEVGQLSPLAAIASQSKVSMAGYQYATQSAAAVASLDDEAAQRGIAKPPDDTQAGLIRHASVKGSVSDFAYRYDSNETTLRTIAQDKVIQLNLTEND